MENKSYVFIALFSIIILTLYISLSFYLERRSILDKTTNNETPKENSPTESEKIEEAEESMLTNISKTEKQPIEGEYKENRVYIYSDRFEPAYIEINSGEEIIFINLDSVEHIIEFSYPPLVKRVLPMENFTFTFISREEIKINSNKGFSMIVKVS